MSDATVAIRERMLRRLVFIVVDDGYAHALDITARAIARAGHEKVLIPHRWSPERLAGHRARQQARKELRYATEHRRPEAEDQASA